MKKIFALGLMVVSFAPFGVLAEAVCSFDSNTGKWVNYGDSGSCSFDGTPQNPAPSGTLPCTYYADGSNNGAAACYDAPAPSYDSAAYDSSSYDSSGPSTYYPSSSNSDYSGGGYGPANAGTGLSGGAGDVSKLVSFLGALLNIATRLILGAAVVYFLWGVFQFVKSAGDEEARQTGKNHIIYGVIGIAVMVSMWGLVNFVTGSINFGTTNYSVPSLLPMPD